MNPKYQQFIFEDYQFDASQKLLTLHYSFDGILNFTETFRFTFEFAAYNPAELDRACQNLFFIAGVSYYKAYLAPEIVIKKGTLDAASAAFFSKTYQRGLGEFFFVNKLDPHTPITFPITTESQSPISPATKRAGALVAVGGGKDSLVSVELLRGKMDHLATWSLGHAAQLTPLVERIGLPHFSIERTWDRQLLTLNEQDAMNGHIPISAIFACVSVVVAILSGQHDVVMSNEQSANEPTLHYEGVAINHQYSKSQEFERDFQAQLLRDFGDSLRYYSFLRPLSELRIAELFARVGFEKYHDVFSSCNRAFTHTSNHLFWDGTCSKCAFVFLALTPFVSQEKLQELFSGKNLLATPELEPTYRQLLGIEGDKPLECVGEIKESRAAMRLASTIHPELTTKYQFDIPEEYDYRQLQPHEMPAEAYALLATAINTL